MEGHQRNLYLYDRFNARVAGISRDDIATLKYWAEGLGITFPLLSNISGYVGMSFGAFADGRSVFSRRTIIIDRRGVIRYARDGSPKYREILQTLKKLHEEDGS